MKRSGATSIFDLPDHILVEILIRLPVKTISDCRCVCMHLHNIISDPDFAKLHLSRPPKTHTLMLRASRWNRDLCLVESVEPHIADGGHNDDVHVPYGSVLRFRGKFDEPDFELEVLSSCNGLICFYSPNSYNPYYICNPVLSEYLIVPQIEKHLFYQLGSGFGFSPNTNQYKLLRFLCPGFSVESSGLLKRETEIITLGTNLWRKIGDAPRYLHWLSNSCFLNGALHWIVHNSDNDFDSVCCFDIGDEQFQQFPGPSQFVGGRNATVHQMDLGLLRGCLSVFHDSSNYQLEIWVMKDYGVKESWTKELVIGLPWPSSHCCPLYKPIMLLNNGEILLLYASSQLLSFNSTNRSFRNVRINGITPFVKAIAYVPSFISIRNAVMG